MIIKLDPETKKVLANIFDKLGPSGNASSKGQHVLRCGEIASGGITTALSTQILTDQKRQEISNILLGRDAKGNYEPRMLSRMVSRVSKEEGKKQWSPTQSLQNAYNLEFNTLRTRSLNGTLDEYKTLLDTQSLTQKNPKEIARLRDNIDEIHNKKQKDGEERNLRKKDIRQLKNLALKIHDEKATQPRIESTLPKKILKESEKNKYLEEKRKLEKEQEQGPIKKRKHRSGKKTNTKNLKSISEDAVPEKRGPIDTLRSLFRGKTADDEFKHLKSIQESKKDDKNVDKTNSGTFKRE